MAIVALHSASTGLSAMAQAIDVIANNLANVNTTGFKAQRTHFEELIYQEKAQPGVENANGDQRPTGIFVGLGTRISGTPNDFTIGSPIPSPGTFDMMIDGNGFFQVQILEEDGGIGYTRAGNFIPNADGELVLGNSDGPRLVNPSLQVDEDVQAVIISKDGTVQVKRAGSVDFEQIGQISLANFVNPAGLVPIGGNIFRVSAASGPPIEGIPGEGNFGGILDKHLESSNVNPVRELIDLIKTQRAFEMNSQTIQAADEVLQVIGNLRRF